MRSLPIIIEEYAGIERADEPITVGVPFPRGMLTDPDTLSLIDPEKGRIPVQTASLAAWPDGSLKWMLLDFQVSVKAGARKEIALQRNEAKTPAMEVPFLRISEEMDTHLRIDTGVASFFVDRKVFKPFSRVLSGEKEIIDGSGSRTILTDHSGVEYLPVIKNVVIETRGSLRTTVKTEGDFINKSSKSALARFLSRLSFFAGSSLVKIEFTIHNPRAAKHPGGLWDLGDPGSIYFKDLSIYAALSPDFEAVKARLDLYEDPVPMVYGHMDPSNSVERKPPPSHSLTFPPSTRVLLYQDSSGGENWQSHNHVNRHGEVKTLFRGYRVYEGGNMGAWESGNIRKEGLRADPVITLSADYLALSASVQYFWQNFPKALEADSNILTVRLFPMYYNDVFELQGGEQKTHTIAFDFGPWKDKLKRSTWVQNPLIAHTSPEWYASSIAIPYLVTQRDCPNKELQELINVAIKGGNTFFHRREIIDEYGWRNFGDFYADHEAVGHEGREPLVSHYNNQYDCIHGAFQQFLMTGDSRWFILADQLGRHVKDIDIYHTDHDRLEYNHGLFWHTEHYIDAQTATHRCFSRMHAYKRDLASYGGGPSLSHVYATGLMVHFLLTGDQSSSMAVRELSGFVLGNMKAQTSPIRRGKELVKKTIRAIQGRRKGPGLVQINKVYGLDGPGRASGNSLGLLVDAYNLTEDEKCLKAAERLIAWCVSPEDDLAKRDLFDVENRWMYTIFLQALGKYLDVGASKGHQNSMMESARRTLLCYALWMKENERPYLETPDKLEYPNETWAAQDLRKGAILMSASVYASSSDRKPLMLAAGIFFRHAVEDLSRFETCTLTRPTIIILQIWPYYTKYQSLNRLEESGTIDGNSIVGIRNHRAT